MVQDRTWLEVWEVDKTSLSLALSHSDHAILRDFLATAEEDLNKVVKMVGVPSDDRDVHDRAYRNVHFILGFCKIMELVKAAHVLAHADYLLDLGRKDGNFTRNSMDYVIKLSINTCLKIFRDIAQSEICNLDTSEIIEECARYIIPLIDMENKAAQERQNIVYDAAPVQYKDNVPQSQDNSLALEVAKSENDSIVSKKIEDFDEDLILSEEQFPLVGEFCSEVRENLQRIDMRLIDLEEAGEDQEIVNDLFRAIHTVKGNARLLAIRKIEMLAHEMESLLGDLRNNERSVDETTIDILMAGNKALTQMTDQVSEHKSLSTPIAHLIQSIQALRQGVALPTTVDKYQEIKIQKKEKEVGEVQNIIPAAGVAEETLRVPTSKLDDVLNTASEVFVTRIRLQSDISALTEAVGELQSLLHSGRFAEITEGSERLQIAAARLEKDLCQNTQATDLNESQSQLRYRLKEIQEAILQSTGETISPAELKLMVQKVDLLRKQLQKDVVSLEGLSSRLQSGAMNFRMVPVSQLFSRFPPLVRDMARQVGKRVKLVVEGNSTELDKVLIGQLVDPLIHIMRNALDHGLETPEDRVALGKQEIGSIRLAAYYEGSYVVIEVGDDGRGVNTQKVISRAIESGLITSDRAAHMTPNEIMALIFEPGFSTASVVSELSGRGVGMDVVKTAVQQMQGSLSVDSTLGQGTLIRIKMPLTLAVVGIVLVEEHGYQFAIPVLNVVEVLSVSRSEFRSVSGAMVMNFRGKTLPISALSAIMGFPSSAFFEEEISVVVISDGEREIGLMVDKLMGRHDVLIKQFGRLVSKLPFLMGCTILSDSRLVSVLNVWEILRSGARSIAKPSEIDQSDHFISRRKYTILVVDDSAIQRNRIAAALVRAGYQAVTAEDGFDALNKVRARRYAACCVDVFMPLIDGLEFVERLKDAPDTQDIPVYMMSGRSVDQHYDRQRLDRLGVLDFFHKPFDIEILINSLDSVLLGEVEHNIELPISEQVVVTEGSPL
jgi:two-component system, chemotaxis family, sensor kinase CheA